MGTERLIGFTSQQRETEAKAVTAAKQKLKDMIQYVIDCAEPTEQKVRDKVHALGYKLITLDFKPRAGVGGEIRGPRTAQFWFRAIWNGYEIEDGTIVRR